MTVLEIASCHSGFRSPSLADLKASYSLWIDVQGADTVKAKMPQAIRIFLAPSNFQELKARLESRLTESSEALLRRLREAEAEMAHSGEFDYVVYNRADELETAVRDIQDVIRKETSRVRT